MRAFSGFSLLKKVMVLNAIALLVFVLLFTVNVPVSDAWAIIPYFKNFNIIDLFRLHNEHCIFIPRLIYILLARLTHWNTLAETLTGLGFYLGSYFLIVRKYLKQGYSENNNTIFLLAVLSQMTAINFENLILGWQLQITLCVFAVVYAFVLLDTSEPRIVRMFLSGLSLLVAAFSFASGVFGIFIASIISLLNRKIKPSVLMGLFGFVMAYIYMVLSMQGARMVMFIGDRNIVRSGEFFFGYIGQSILPILSVEQPFIPGPLMLVGPVVVGGMLFTIILCLLYFSWKAWTRDMIFPFAMILFGLFNGFATVSRVGLLGVFGSQSSRYHIFSGLIFLGGVWLFVILKERLKLVRFDRVAIVILIGVYLFAWVGGGVAGFIFHHKREVIKQKILSNKHDANDLEILYAPGKAENARGGLKILKDLKYNLYKDQ
jgi:hypothetical protein